MKVRSLPRSFHTWDLIWRKKDWEGANANHLRYIGIERDSSDPDLLLNARMRQLGPVSPNPTMSNSSTFNTSSHLRAPQDRFSTPRSNLSSNQNLSAAASAPQFQPSASNPEQSIFPTGNNVGGRENPAVSLLTARYRLAEEAEREFASIGRKGSEGRTFLDVVTLRQVLVMRERGVEEGEIERKLGLGRGVVGKLGRRDVVGVGSWSVMVVELYIRIMDGNRDLAMGWENKCIFCIWYEGKTEWRGMESQLKPKDIYVGRVLSHLLLDIAQQYLVKAIGSISKNEDVVYLDLLAETSQIPPSESITIFMPTQRQWEMKFYIIIVSEYSAKENAQMRLKASKVTHRNLQFFVVRTIEAQVSPFTLQPISEAPFHNPTTHPAHCTLYH
jgi:hypothetical protein